MLQIIGWSKHKQQLDFLTNVKSTVAPSCYMMNNYLESRWRWVSIIYNLKICDYLIILSLSRFDAHATNKLQLAHFSRVDLSFKYQLKPNTIQDILFLKSFKNVLKTLTENWQNWRRYEVGILSPSHRVHGCSSGWEWYKR